MKVIWKIFKGILIACLVIMLIFVIFQKVTDSKLTIGNVYVFQVATESMTPEYQVGDIIVVKKADPSKIEVGDDVTYLGKKSDLKNKKITHRVITKNKKEDKYYFVTQGIANENADPEISEDDIYGKVAYHAVVLSFVGRIMMNPIAYYVIFILVAASFSYEIITSFLVKKDDIDEEEN